MPYVFLTFDEIGDLFHCDSAGARDRVVGYGAFAVDQPQSLEAPA